ncbi:MAG TPA: HD domain-containing phosphohydrolase, partial [Burkholderiales bacterium]|nr:HD domain-containing phosphohydrolase [Burkholderiales bacterium]
GCNDFLNKPVDALELVARTRSLMQLKLLTDQLESAETVLRTLARTLEAKDSYTQGHSERVADYTARLAAAIGLSVEDQNRLRRAGLLHDIGKSAVRDSVLHKPGALTDEEFEHIKIHPVVGERILQDLKSAQPYLSTVRHHHERTDGTGYPDGLRGEAIPLDASLMAIADAYDAMTSHRPYRAAMPQEEALAILAENRGPQWDPEFVKAFVAMIRNAPRASEADGPATSSPPTSEREFPAPHRPEP